MPDLEAALLELAGAIDGLVGELELELAAVAAALEALVLAARPAATPVLAATVAELAELGSEIAGSAIAASALRLASELDGPDATAAEVASCARALRAAMDRLHELAPGDAGGDGVDEIARQRERRRAGAAGT